MDKTMKLEIEISDKIIEEAKLHGFSLDELGQAILNSSLFYGFLLAHLGSNHNEKG